MLNKNTWLIVRRTAVLLFMTSSVSAAEEYEIPAYYDVKTGDLTIDATVIEKFGGYIWSLKFDGFEVKNYTPFTNGPLSGGWTASSIGETDFSAITPGVYSLGEILPAGLTVDDLEPYFKDQWAAAYGIGAGFTYDMVPVYSPSPFPALNADVVIPPAGVVKWATKAQITYDVRDGELSLDTTGDDGGAIFGYSLQFLKPIIDTGAFQPIGNFPSSSAWRVVETAEKPSGIDAGIYSLGTILPRGLSQQDVVEIVAGDSGFIGQPGHTAGSLDLEVSGIEFSLAYVVPEPESGLLLGIAAFVLMTFVRKRASRT